jgi:hypothetical protein
MVVTPAVRGLFGLEWDALHHTLRVTPNLPATWDHARVRHVPLGNDRVDLEFAREKGRLVLRAHSTAPVTVCLASLCGAPGTAAALVAPLPAVELEVPHGLPLAGATTGQLKVLGEGRSPRGFQIDFTAPGGSSYELPVRLNRPGVKLVNGGELTGNQLRLRFPEGPGYTQVAVSFAW